MSTQKGSPAAISTSASLRPARTQPKIATTKKKIAAIKCRNRSGPWMVQAITRHYWLKVSIMPVLPSQPHLLRTTWMFPCPEVATFRQADTKLGSMPSA